jgi:hypothetical protein
MNRTEKQSIGEENIKERGRGKKRGVFINDVSSLRIVPQCLMRL